MRHSFIILIVVLMNNACSHALRPEDSRAIQQEVYFRFDRDTLSETQEQNIHPVLSHLRTHPESVLIVEGHTDSRGAQDYNLELGDRRARRVKAYLTVNGIKPERLVTVTYGEEAPKRNLSLAHPLNRRVVISGI